jgi:RNA polymerase sigma-70 factor (ECF subfamily)
MPDSRQRLVDELLVLRCQDGDAEAFDRLVRRWQKRLWRHAFRLTGRADAAWDALQEAWMAAVRGIRRLDDPARFRQWVYRIVSNKCADWVRGVSRRRRLSEELSRQGGQSSPRDAAPDDADTLAVALRRLSGDHRAVLSLRYLEGFGTAEIADILGLREGTVKSRLHYARNELKRILEGMES